MSDVNLVTGAGLTPCTTEEYNRINKDTKFSTGAVRSSETNQYNFTSLPMIGLLALARTAGEGMKYGRFNYLKGMPIHDLLEHSFRHIVMYNAGDRSETHLAHAAWGLLVAIQEEVLRPEANAEHMLGPGCSITPAMAAYMEKMKPILAERRANADADAFTWNIFDLADVRKLREQHDAVNCTADRIKVANELMDNMSGLSDWADDEGFAVIPEKKAEALGPPPETLMEWCYRNPMAASIIDPSALGLSGTGCPEPFASGPIAPRTVSHIPVKQHKSSGNPEAFDYYDAKSTPGGYFPRS